jgi:hypothetical protein
MSEDKLDKLMRHAYGLARDAIVKGDTAHMTFFAECRNGEVYAIIYPSDWASDAERNFVLTMMRMLFLLKGVVRYVHLAECWDLYADEEGKLPPGGDQAREDRQISKHPNRKEMLSVMGSDGVRKAMGIADLGVDADGHRTCGKLNVVDANASESPMTRLLDDGIAGLPAITERVASNILKIFQDKLLPISVH